MADTGDKKYNIKEAVNRIYRVLKNSVSPDDAPESLSGQVLSVDEALSKLAELFEGNLAGETFTLPTGAEINQFTVEDIEVNDSVSARTLDSTAINAGTGTFYAGYGEVSIGGFSDDDLFGNGEIVLGIGPASSIPSGTLTHLGGVLFAQGGALKWLGSSGSVTTLAGS